MVAGHAYQRLAAELHREFVRGLWQTGDRLPSETALARAYRVSRRTVRQALELLQQEGVISKAQGRYTIYRERAVSWRAGKPLDFLSAAREAGYRPSTRLVSSTRRISTLSEAKALQLDLDERVLEICRIRLLEGHPVAFQVSLLPDAFTSHLKVDQLKKASLYAVLRTALQNDLFVARERVSLINATAREATALATYEGAPLLRLERLVVDGTGRPVEYSDAALEASFFRLQHESPACSRDVFP
ncbi:GntR family transcriptional regulator [Amorphus orientalis]|uniref:GntR family transcriptional regulator n=1 Tax=Amorphus orientalis TaxID=649198 RepID=A0AAE3VMZ4_9HYPH|nr:GntR family transcriptional regulator [Amorphus orientalis]MDQ0314898.1 GntR family transcriptional regulator [Amorphus orientalis]